MFGMKRWEYDNDLEDLKKLLSFREIKNKGIWRRS